MKRAIWALAVVCLLAATGVQPVRTAEADARTTAVSERLPALPAIVAARQASVVVALRSDVAHSALPPAVLGALPALAIRAVRAVDLAPRCTHAPGSARVATCSARGPPVG